MAVFEYTTSQDDVLDDIVNRYYGLNVMPISYVLAFNPGLADWGCVYEAGRKILLPDLPAKAVTVPIVNPWS